MKKYCLFLLLILFSAPAFSQNNLTPADSVEVLLQKLAKQVDTLNLKIKDIIVTGNKITKEYVILRELEFKKGDIFKAKKYINSINNLNNLGLFTRADIIPIPVNDNEISLNIDVKERWYILPIPGGGVDEGEYFKKLWGSLNIRWDNFRGRNETLSLYGRIFYNPAVKFTYKNPWFGGKLHLFSVYSIGYSRIRNQSIQILGIPNGENTIPFEHYNFENFIFNTDLTLGKYLSRQFSIFLDGGYNTIRVSEYAPGRTFSSSGKDKYMNFGAGFEFDSRDNRDFTTKGLYLRSTISGYSFIDNPVKTGRYTFESRTFLPIPFSKTYSMTLASRLLTSLVIGHDIPIYQHEFLGYNDNYVRGWSGKAYEGEHEVLLYNELRIPLYQPRYIYGSKVPIVRDIPVLNHMDLKHGLYLAVIYDIGTVFNHTEKITKQRFLSGAGLGLDVILPFGIVGRADWVFRLDKPVVGQIGFGLSAKF